MKPGMGIGRSAVLLVAVVCRMNAATIEKSEFIYEHAPFPSCHASTIAETKSGLIAAWFGGSGVRRKQSNFSR